MLISALGWPSAQTGDTGGSGRTGVGTRYPPFGTEVGVFSLKALGIRIWAFCAVTSRLGTGMAAEVLGTDRCEVAGRAAGMER
jgi:hypothetical protein